MLPVKKRPFIATGESLPRPSQPILESRPIKTAKRPKGSASKSTGKSSGARTKVAARVGPREATAEQPTRRPAPRNNPRAQRQRFRPLEYWRGERVVYGQSGEVDGGADGVGAAFERIVDVIVVAGEG